MRQKLDPYNGMTPTSTQNLKALGLWIFFFIYCLTFSFLVNVKLRLTFRYPTNKKEHASSVVSLKEMLTTDHILSLD